MSDAKVYIYTFRASILEAWEAGRLAVKVPCVRFGTSIYTFRASIPEAWEAGRLEGWEWLGGRLAGWAAGRESVNVPLRPVRNPYICVESLGTPPHPMVMVHKRRPPSPPLWLDETLKEHQQFIYSTKTIVCHSPPPPPLWYVRDE